MSLSYIATNTKELFDAAPADIKLLLTGGEVKSVATTLVKIHKIPIGLATRLTNIITFILIGALQPDRVIDAIKELLEFSNEQAIALAKDLETSILEKARITLLNKENTDIKTLEFKGERTPDELRKELLDTTKRESAFIKPQSTNLPPKKASILTPGSRSQLLEQLQIIGSIPNDEEIESRLKHIQEQIVTIKKQEDNTLESNIALKSFMFGEKGKEVVKPKLGPSTYSTAPTEYNIDPYREIVEE
jgi:hypothetical protein